MSKNINCSQSNIHLSMNFRISLGDNIILLKQSDVIYKILGLTVHGYNFSAETKRNNRLSYWINLANRRDLKNEIKIQERVFRVRSCQGSEDHWKTYEAELRYQKRYWAKQVAWDYQCMNSKAYELGDFWLLFQTFCLITSYLISMY